MVSIDYVWVKGRGRRGEGMPQSRGLRGRVMKGPNGVTESS